MNVLRRKVMPMLKKQTQNAENRKIISLFDM